MDFSNFDEELFLDNVCREYSDPYLRFRKYVFVLTERAILQEGFHIMTVVNLVDYCGIIDDQENIESLFEEYRKFSEKDKSDLMILGLVHSIYDGICFYYDLEKVDMKKIHKKMLLPLTIAYLLCDNKKIIEKIFGLRFEKMSRKLISKRIG